MHLSFKKTSVHLIYYLGGKIKNKTQPFSFSILAYLKRAAVSPLVKVQQKSVVPSATSRIKCPAARKAK